VKNTKSSGEAWRSFKKKAPKIQRGVYSLELIRLCKIFSNASTEIHEQGEKAILKACELGRPSLALSVGKHLIDRPHDPIP